MAGKSSMAQKSAPGKRADSVRQKRGERSQQRVSEATRRAAHPVRVRPVVVRGSAFGTPIHQRAATKAPRRAFYVTMDSAAGSELRLPALPTLHASWRILSSIIALAALFGIYNMWNADLFRVGGVQVQGLERITGEEVNKTLNVEMLSIVEVDRGALLEKMVHTFPELVGVRVTVELPNRVEVRASERQPVIAWKKGDSITWVDEEGVAFPARGAVEKLITLETKDDLPLAAAPAVALDDLGIRPAEEKETAGPQKVRPELVQATQLLSQKLPENTRLVYSAENGLGWVEKEGWQVFIGSDLNNFEERYAMYQALVNHLQGQGQRPVLISVEHINAPFYRLEP